ncbi:rab9 effector protein with kelch motifs [Protopterus annectens]|uniref:rab9 effector protein with kelch motifs n=1 Tax=Protopterus annectens TaxID=7888 RepID=UPI001CFB3AAD|nr:rab9 effector protein with kelch motifs [Protopterus annectens]
MELLEVLGPNNIPEKGTWYALVPTGQIPSVRVGHTCLHIPQTDGKGQIVVVGGANLNGSFSDAYILDLDAYEWDIPLWEGLLPRYEHASFCPTNNFNSLWVFGGADQYSNRNCVQVLDSEKGFWRSPAVGGTAPSARTFHTATAAIGNNLYIFGGGDKGTEPVHDTELHVFDSVALTWSQPVTHGKPPAARHGHVVVAVGTSLYIHGGLAGNRFYADMFCIDTVDMKWNKVNMTGDVPSGRAAHSGVAFESLIYIFGGMNTAGALNTMHKYCTETRCWSLVKFVSALPSSRLDHSMCIIPWKIPFLEAHRATCYLEDSKTVSTGEDLKKQTFSTEEESEKTDSKHQVPKHQEKTSTSQDKRGLYLCLIFGGMNTDGEMYNDCIVTAIE